MTPTFVGKHCLTAAAAACLSKSQKQIIDAMRGQHLYYNDPQELIDKHCLKAKNTHSNYTVRIGYTDEKFNENHRITVSWQGIDQIDIVLCIDSNYFLDLLY